MAVTTPPLLKLGLMWGQSSSCNNHFAGADLREKKAFDFSGQPFHLDFRVGCRCFFQLNCGIFVAAVFSAVILLIFPCAATLFKRFLGLKSLHLDSFDAVCRQLPACASHWTTRICNFVWVLEVSGLICWCLEFRLVMCNFQYLATLFKRFRMGLKSLHLDVFDAVRHQLPARTPCWS